MIEILTPAEAARQLRQLGMHISTDTLRFGLQQGMYPFGLYIQCDDSPVYQIFKKLFDEWVQERNDSND